CVGGAQAIAALAFGTESIPRVAKIVGPGNAYVAAAKRLVYGDVGIDTIAGPSEVAILADASADPRLIAADLIAQAEHDDAFVLIVTTEPKLLSMISAEIEAQMPSLDRAATIRAALADSIAIVTEDLAEAIDWINRIGPEHLELFVADPLAVVLRIQSAGVILCGPYAPAAVCDYGIGPNHVLPTGGTGRFASALGVDDFLRRVSVVSVTRDAFSAIARDGIALAEVEGLTAHAAALRIRLEDLR
ncbi:histidinol dehydrogenase, partial [Candidatus Bipolaricaulota bacterium]|nr:histidinol dehydrogenase [Candidatus Bipolaricaulota bacterium]